MERRRKLLDELKRENVPQFADKVVSRIPELREILLVIERQKRYSLYMDLYTFWEEGFTESLLYMLRNKEMFSMVLPKMFALIEDMVVEREMTKTLVFSSTFRNLVANGEVQSVAVPLMGPQTKSLWEKYQDSMRQFRLWKLSQMEEN